VQVVGREDYMRIAQTVREARAGCARGSKSGVSKFAEDIAVRKIEVGTSHDRREQELGECVTQNSLTFFRIFDIFAFYSPRDIRST